MSVGAVTKIGEHVPGFRERRLANPRCSFSAHLRKSRGGSIHELGEVMAPYAGERAAPFRDLGGGVVRAARAEIRGATERHHVPSELSLFCFEKSEALGDAWRGVKARNALGDDPGDLGRRQLAVRRQYPVAAFVELADDPRADVLAPIVELLLKLVLDDRALFLDYQYLFESLGEVPDALAFQRPGHRHLVQAEADLGGMRFVNPEIVERLAHVEVGFAGSGDPEPWPRAVDDDSVEPVGACESQRGVKLIFMKAVFLIERLIGPADIQTAGRHLEIIGKHDFDALGADLDRGRTVDGLGNCFKGYPAPRIARHCPAIEPKVEDFLHSRRV